MKFSSHAVLVALVLVAGCRSASEPLRIGLAGAFSDPVGRPMVLGARLAVSEINATGGIAGRQLQLIEMDDYGEPDSAIVVANALYASDAVAVVGHLYSGTTLAAAPVYNSGANPVVAISPSSSSPEVSRMGPYTFRVCPSDNAHGEALARWLREQLGLRRGSVFYLNDQYGRGVRERFAAEFIRRGGELLTVAPYLGDDPDVAAYVERLARQPANQFIMVAGNLSEAAAFLRETRARGIALPLLGADGLEGIEQLGELAEGVYESLAYLPQLETLDNRRFVAAYRTRYPDEPLPNQPAAASYDAIHILKQAVKAAGSSREQVRDGVSQINAQNPFDGVTGSIAFDSLGDVPSREVYIAVVRNGALRLAGAR